MEMKLTYITIHTMEPEIMKDFYVNHLIDFQLSR